MLACAALSATLAGGPRSAHAQTPPPVMQPDAQTLAEARRHFDLALALHNQHNLDGALAEFQRAYQLAGRPSVLFNISSTQQALHQYPEAMRSLREFLALPGATPQLRRDAQRALTELQELVARVSVETTPANTPFTVDGRAPALVNGELVLGPGRHVFEANREGFRSAREEITVASGEARIVRLVLQEIPPVVVPVRPDPPPPRVVQPATLAVTNAPPEASLLVNGERHGTQDPLSLAPGDYALTVNAPGTHPWNGRVTLAEGRAHGVRVDLAQQGMHPAGFAVSLALTAVAGIATAALSGYFVVQRDALRQEFASFVIADEEYERMYGALPAGQLRPTTQELENQRLDGWSGDLMARARTLEGLMTAAITTGVVTGVGAVVTAIVGVRTEFSPRRSTGVFRVVPAPSLTAGGVGGGVSISTPF